MYCSLSGVTPKEPVVSRTGYIFERRLVEEHIQRLGTCPVTKEPLGENDLTDIKVNRIVKPRTAVATSIPAMLQTFQNEWDSLMVETFELRKQLDQLRTELATALYKQDAAERTIARLIRERDHAREEAKSGRQVTQAELDHQPSSMEIQGGGLSVAQEQLLDSTAQALIEQRSERTVEPGTATAADVAHLKEKASLVVSKHVTSVTVDGAVAAVASADGSVSLLDWSKGTTLGGSKSGSSGGKAVNGLAWISGQGTSRMLLTASADSTVKLWSVAASGALSLSHDFNHLHSDAVSALAVHPCGRMFASAARDSTWALVDLQVSSTVYTVEGQEKFNAIRFHPDGLLVATAGDDAQHSLRIWDVKSKEDVIALTSHTGPVTAVAFSENGYFLATGSQDSTVRVWDLRNLDTPLLATETFGKGAVRAVEFDFSGQYLAAGGAEGLSCFGVHDAGLKHASRLAGHKSTVTGVAWSRDAHTLLSGAADGTVKIWSK